ncbi:NAD(P)/FAD-dependent oxidoreductase [Rhizobium miluonense]|uniref:Glycine/D-amino acid oxidase n=1 Tax=Rhizobium miluonense TaxID=411945 RepID=A0A1C3WE10_9HYPH|nr:FAD-binding oxidoreductase [Rhizobium miluonense]SCB38096.1 Glycine/D-amino acid oxidase [Rhizobium miluonense]
MRVIVIGAGAIGCSVAYHLAKEGATVTVVDPEGLRAGATLTSFAWLNCHDKKPEDYYRLVMRGNLAHRELGEEIGHANWLRLTGALEWWPADTQKAKDHSVRLNRLRSYGHPIEILNADDVISLEPDVSRSSLEGCEAVFYPTDASVDTVVYRHVLMREAERRGTRLIEARVHNLLERSGRIVGVRLDNRSELEADYVINCAGCAINTVGAELGHAVPLEWKPGMTVITDVSRNNVSRIMKAPEIYIKPERAGRLLLHAKSADLTLKDITAFDAGEAGARQIAALVENVLPTVGGVKITAIRISVRPYPADGMPVFGPLPGIEGYHVAVTHSGISLSPLIGQAAVEEILYGRTSKDFELFRPTRFSHSAPSAT